MGGGAPTHLCLHPGHLLTANYASGTVSVLPVGAAARSAAAPVLRHEGNGPDPERQEGPHAHRCCPTPPAAGSLSVDLGTDSVRVCELDADSGELEVRARDRACAPAPARATWPSIRAATAPTS